MAVGITEMKIIGTNQLAQARFAPPLPKGLLANGWRSLMGKIRTPLFYGLTTAFCALAVTVLSVGLIGGLDRLGVVPQDSFMGLSLTLIACCLFLLLSPLRTKVRFSRAAQDASAGVVTTRQLEAEPTGKLLIIRRKSEVWPSILEQQSRSVN